MIPLHRSSLRRLACIGATLTAAPSLAHTNAAAALPVASAAPVASAVPALPVAPDGQQSIVDVWGANQGATLSETLSGWAERAKWKLIWESDSDFRLAAAGDFEGSFEDAAQKLILAFGRTRPRLRATFYGGNSVLRVWAERAEP